jgi:hypothetical protein
MNAFVGVSKALLRRGYRRFMSSQLRQSVFATRAELIGVTAQAHHQFAATLVRAKTLDLRIAGLQHGRVSGLPIGRRRRAVPGCLCLYDRGGCEGSSEQQRPVLHGFVLQIFRIGGQVDFPPARNIVRRAGGTDY